MRVKSNSGFRKCRRCKKDFPDNGINNTCIGCRGNCATCGVVLTGSNKSKNTSYQYYCKRCVAARVRKTVDKVARKNYDLNRNYGITLDEYNEMLKSQGGVCSICGNPPKRLALSVDHKHQPNETKIKKKGEMEKIRMNVRGLLCWNCNAGLKRYHDKPEFLRKAAFYLENWPAQKVIKND